MRISRVSGLVGALVVLLVEMSSSAPSYCLSCDQSACPDVNTCVAGVVPDDCRCCLRGICAQGEGDECGGFMNYAGRCAFGMNCDRVNSRFNQLPGVCKQG